MSYYKPPKVGTKYGAPMGRANSDTYTDKRGRTFQITVTDDAPPFTLQRVRLDRGGYDSGGAYWGLGEPLYRYESHCSDISGYVRGATRDKAKEEVRALHPNARFYR